MFKAEVLEMPFVEALPKREKTKVQKVWDVLEEISRVSSEKGTLIPQSFAALLLDVSRQRVNQLVDLDRLETFSVMGVPFVTERSLVEYAKSERKAGRPHKLPVDFSECRRRAKRGVKKS